MTEMSFREREKVILKQNFSDVEQLVICLVYKAIDFRKFLEVKRQFGTVSNFKLEVINLKIQLFDIFNYLNNY